MHLIDAQGIKTTLNIYIYISIYWRLMYQQRKFINAKIFRSTPLKMPRTKTILITRYSISRLIIHEVYNIKFIYIRGIIIYAPKRKSSKHTIGRYLTKIKNILF